ncbi:YkgJ family cysteine cluster protein [Maridesulfovibrio sp.]|uniref:YkgJ family cysteine cluster protein n=1 Tax=Maridesulfovibrio sp. TaxID=2795000 RepID=UPI002A18E191|nr:YkgJ family cysteine cluster protein [Maridesulfovibrio sp.]
MNECKQCGTCCRKGGPALHKQDLPLLEEAGGIDITDIVTIRKGELAYNQPEGEVGPLQEEILKIKGAGGTWSCKFLSPSTQVCRIYKNRPLECRKLFCGDTEPLLEIYNKDRISRRDLLPEGHPVLELIAEHDSKCSPERMAELAAEAIEHWNKAENLKADLREILIYDKSIRDLVVEKTGLPAEAMDFFFGRSASIVLKGYGIIATANGNSFSLRKSS